MKWEGLRIKKLSFIEDKIKIRYWVDETKGWLIPLVVRPAPSQNANTPSNPCKCTNRPWQNGWSAVRRRFSLWRMNDRSVISWQLQPVSSSWIPSSRRDGHDNDASSSLRRRGAPARQHGFYLCRSLSGAGSVGGSVRELRSVHATGSRGGSAGRRRQATQDQPNQALEAAVVWTLAYLTSSAYWLQIYLRVSCVSEPR